MLSLLGAFTPHTVNINLKLSGSVVWKNTVPVLEAFQMTLY